MTFAEKAKSKLNGITQEQIRDTNWWSDIVMILDGFDQDLTDRLDTGYNSTFVGFEDGSYCMFTNDGYGWEAYEIKDFKGGDA